MFISSLSILFNKGKEYWKKHSPKALIEYTQNSARIQTMSLKQREGISLYSRSQGCGHRCICVGFLFSLRIHTKTVITEKEFVVLIKFLEGRKGKDWKHSWGKELKGRFELPLSSFWRNSPGFPSWETRWPNHSRMRMRILRAPTLSPSGEQLLWVSSDLNSRHRVLKSRNVGWGDGLLGKALASKA